VLYLVTIEHPLRISGRLKTSSQDVPLLQVPEKPLKLHGLLDDSVCGVLQVVHLIRLQGKGSRDPLEDAALRIVVQSVKPHLDQVEFDVSAATGFG
jgi:hypothetical protein